MGNAQKELSAVRKTVAGAQGRIQDERRRPPEDVHRQETARRTTRRVASKRRLKPKT
jgi:hypothetical protein